MKAEVNSGKHAESCKSCVGETMKAIAFGELTVTRTPPLAERCLYLRLLNIPVPTVYFNTAGDPNWVFD